MSAPLEPPFPPRNALDIAAYDNDECTAGYADCRPDDPAPGANHSPAFRWGWTNRCRDRSRDDDGFDALRQAYVALRRSPAPDIDRPKKPAPKDRYLTKDEARAILAAAALPHVRLAIHLMLATAARISAILELPWSRVDFKRRLIYLTDPDDKTPRKGRATVPINDTLFAALVAAKGEALSDYVVEWGGQQVRSIKRSIETAARLAGLADVSPHVFRHTAAVWMAEAGVPLTEIAQYLGHSTPAITYRVYSRYSPDHLRGAAKALDVYEVPAVTREPVNRNVK